MANFHAVEVHRARFARSDWILRKNVDVSHGMRVETTGRKVRTGKKAVVRLGDIARVEASFREVSAFAIRERRDRDSRSPSRPALLAL